MKRSKLQVVLIALFLLTAIDTHISFSQEDPFDKAIFDDKLMLDGYAQNFSEYSKDTLFAMIKDDNLSAFKMAAAIRVFREKHCMEVLSKERNMILKHIIRRLHRTTSPFVQVEAMYAICTMRRYKYFKSMVPGLILKMDHYNATVNALAYNSVTDIIKTSKNKPREARIIFNTLRKILFLSRRRIENIAEPDERLNQKLEIVRWAIKIMGSQELRHLPKEVINLL